MWIKNDKTCCENCGIHMAAFYEYDAENYLCPECTAEMNEHKEFEECEWKYCHDSKRQHLFNL